MMMMMMTTATTTTATTTTRRKKKIINDKINSSCATTRALPYAKTKIMSQHQRNVKSLASFTFLNLDCIRYIRLGLGWCDHPKQAPKFPVAMSFIELLHCEKASSQVAIACTPRILSPPISWDVIYLCVWEGFSKRSCLLLGSSLILFVSLHHGLVGWARSSTDRNNLADLRFKTSLNPIEQDKTQESKVSDELPLLSGQFSLQSEYHRLGGLLSQRCTQSRSHGLWGYSMYVV